MATTIDHATTTVPWHGIFDTPAETAGEITDTEGSLPDGLVGSLYRNGPGRLDLADHLFDGDGMVSRVSFEPGGRVRFANRFVRTRKYQLELGATRPQVTGFGTRATGGMLKNALRPPSGDANAANTNLVFTKGRLLALWEAGRPWEIDPDTLETIGEMDFDGRLAARSMFSAHPHWDPKRREILNFGMVYGPKSAIAAYRIDAEGRLHHLARVPIPAPVMNHDFIVTDRYLVFCLGPVRPNLFKLLSGLQSFGDSLRWHGDEPTRVVLVPRDGGDPVTVETEPWFQFHFAGAFDDGDDVVIDLARFESWDAIAGDLKRYRTGEFTAAHSPLARYRVTPATGRVEWTPLADADVEFPQVDGRRATGGYANVYAAVTPPGRGLFTAVGRIETATGAVDVHDFGPGRVVSEPIFVPRPGGEADDDGWLLALVFDPDRQASDAVVLDARRPSAGPRWVGRLPVNTGLSFHGTWRPA